MLLYILKMIVSELFIYLMLLYSLLPLIVSQIWNIQEQAQTKGKLCIYINKIQ